LGFFGKAVTSLGPRSTTSFAGEATAALCEVIAEEAMCAESTLAVNVAEEVRCTKTASFFGEACRFGAADFDRAFSFEMVFGMKEILHLACCREWQRATGN